MPNQYVVFTPEQFHALDDKLTEISQGGGGIADGSVTTAKLADDAVTTAKLANRAVTTDKLADKAVTLGTIDDRTVRAMHNISLVAADSQANQALMALGFPHSTLAPAQMVEDEGYADSSYRLCWISGTSLEVAPITFVGNLQTQAITLYAKGYKSTASGILGVDESWTITALPTDADGVSY